MSESEKRLINAIKHYQDSLDRHANSGSSEKLLHAIDKLSRLPIKVCHLEETGVGRTVNALKKVGGTVGENARILVDKWKSMVKGEEEAEQELEKEKEDNDEAESPDDDEDAGESLQICENETGSDLEKEAEKSEEDTDKHQRTPSKKDSKYKETESKSKERHKTQSKRSRSSDDSSSSDEETKHKSKSHKSHHKSSKSSRKSSSSDSNSESDSDESNSDKKSASRKSRSRKSSSSSESSESESESSEEDSSVERKSKKSSSHHHSDKKHKKRHNSSDSEDSDTKHKSKSSKEKREKSSELKNNKHKSESSSKDRKTPKVKESDNEIKKSSKSEDRTKTKDDKSKRDNHDKKESSRSSSSKSTSSEKEKSKAKNDVENERHKSKVSETSESKKSSSKSDKNHKSEKKRERESSTERSPSKRAKESKDSSSERSKSKDKKEKDNADSKKDKNDRNIKKESGGSTSNNKNNKLKPQQKSAVKSINGIDSESGASFADVLGMLEPSMYKSKKKSNDTGVVQEKVKTKEDKSQKLEKQNKPSTSSSSSSVPIPEELSLLKEPNLEPLDINISSLLPSITPNNYRPVSFPVDTQPKKFLSQDEALNHVISAKHQRTKVYSGNKIGCGKVPSLFDMCTRILQDNIDALEYTGGVPYSILKPILEKGTPDQLFQLEFHNPYLIEDSDELWLLHCQKEFRNKKREELESWREMYMRCLDEREAKLKALTANIKQAQDKSIPVRTTKLAYVDSVAKPPRNIARRQAKNGTSIDIRKPTTTPTERLNQLAKSGEAGKMSVPNPGRVAVERSNNHSHSSHLKPKKAPLMAKTLSFLKGTRFGRR